MRKVRHAVKSERDAADRPVPRIHPPHFPARTERHLATTLFALAFVTGPSENEFRSCFKRNSRNT